MKTKSIRTLILLGLMALNVHLAIAYAQGTAFTYNGRLSCGGVPAAGIYDFQFSLYDSTNVSGNLIAGPVTNSATAVSNGLFTVILDFGPGVFTGANRWLEIGVQTNGGTNFTTLTPCQPILPTPYAIMANSASNLLGIVSATQLNGVIANQNLPSNPNISGSISALDYFGNGDGLTNLNPSSIAPGYVNSQLTFTSGHNFFNGGFNGYYTGDGTYITNLNPSSISSGNVNSPLTFTSGNNFFNGGFNGYYTGDGTYITNLNPSSIAPGNVNSQLTFTSGNNFFNGGFNGYYIGDGTYITNLNPSSIAPGNVNSQLTFTSGNNFFNGGFNGYYTGDGTYITNLNPSSIAPGNVNSQLTFTSGNNFFNGGFNGYYTGDGSGLTNLNADTVVGGLTTNLVVSVPTGTAILCFTNGILRAIR